MPIAEYESDVVDRLMQAAQGTPSEDASTSAAKEYQPQSDVVQRLMTAAQGSDFDERRYEQSRRLGLARDEVAGRDESWQSQVNRRLPFVGIGFNIGNNMQTAAAQGRVADNSATDEDYLRIATQERLGQIPQEQSTGRRIVEAALDIPAFGVEYAATAGAFRAGSAAAQRAVQGTVQGSTRRGVGLLAGAGAQTLANPGRIVESATQRQTEGELGVAPRTFWSALPAGAVDAFTETFTERLGGTLAFRAVGRVPGAILNRMGMGNATSLIQAGAVNRLRQFGIHNPLAEIGEERAGELMRGLILGQGMGERDTFGASGQVAGAVGSAARGDTQAAMRQSGEALHQLFIEGAAFTLVSGGGNLGARGLDRIMQAPRGTPEFRLRQQIEAEVQRQQQLPPAPAPAELAEAEQAIERQLGGQQSPQVQPPQQQPLPAAQRTPQTQETGPQIAQIEPEAQPPAEKPPNALVNAQGPGFSGPTPMDQGPPSAGERRNPERRARFESQEQVAVQRLMGRGWTDAMIADARAEGLFAQDVITGFQEGRTGRARQQTVQRAAEHVGLTGAPGVFVSFDLANLGGINAVLGENGANKFFAQVSRIVREEMGQTAGDAQLFRHGGDEMSAVVVNADREAVTEAMRRAQRRVVEASRTAGLHEIEHPKYKGVRERRGTGIYFGVSDITGTSTLDDLSNSSGLEVEARKKKQANSPPSEALSPIERMRRGSKPTAGAVAQAPKDIRPGIKEPKAPEPFKPEAVKEPVKLTETEQQVLGLRNNPELPKKERSFRAIGLKLGVSYETVRLAEQSALAKQGETRSITQQGLEEKAEVVAEIRDAIAAAGRGEEVDVSEQGLSVEQLEAGITRRMQTLDELEDAYDELQNKTMKRLEDAKEKGLELTEKEAAAYLRALDRLDKRSDRRDQEGEGESEELQEDAGQSGFGRPVTEEERRAATVAGGQEDAEGLTRLAKETALANAVTKAERELRQLPAIIAEARKADPEVWDAAMERLARNPNASAALVDEINKKPRPTSDVEGAMLDHRRVSLDNEYDRAMYEYVGESRKHGNADQAKLNALEIRERWLLNQIDQTDKAAVASGRELARGFRWRRKLVTNNFTLSGMLIRAEAAKGEPLTNQEKMELLELNQKIAELQKLLDQAIKDGKTKAGQSSDTDFELTQVKGKFERGLKKDRAARDPWSVKALRLAGETISIPRSLMAAIDFPLLRQGMVATLSHPVRTARGIPEMFRSFFSAQVSERALYELQHRPNAKLYEAAGLDLTNRDGDLSRQEEFIMTRLLGRVPGIGHLARASERAYQTTLNRIRADSFDAMASALSRKGELTTIEAKVLANYANVMTGRGSLGKFENAGTLLNQVFFAPKWAMSRFQIILGQPLWTMQGGLAPRARMEVAKEYGRMLAGLGVVIGLAVAAGFDFEKDPRSADFGKLRLGNTRLDLTGGLSSTFTFLSRLFGGVKLQGGRVRPVEAGDIGRFVRQKLAPSPGAAINLATGRNVVGERVTPASEALGLVTPLFARSTIEVIQDLGVPKGTAVSLVGLMGMGANTYGPRPSR